MKTITTHSPEETMKLAERVGKQLREGDFVALTGELGAGKTVFVKGLAKAVGVKDYLYVNSPSFMLMKEYIGKKKLYHFDTYRLDGTSFHDTIDFEQYFYGDGIAVVEWSDKIRDILPDEYLEVNIKHAGPTDREITIRAFGKRMEGIAEKILAS